MEVKMEQEFSTLKKVKILIIVVAVYGLIFLITKVAMNYFQATSEAKATTDFFFIVYAAILISMATVEINSKLSVKFFQVLLYISIGVIFSGIVNLLTSCFYDLTLYNVSGWATLIGGLYLFFIWGISQGGLDK
jgi:hypothetical protein